MGRYQDEQRIDIFSCHHLLPLDKVFLTGDFCLKPSRFRTACSRQWHTAGRNVGYCFFVFRRRRVCLP